MSEPQSQQPPALTAEELHSQRVTSDRLRLRWTILELRRQVRNSSMLDALLSCLTPAMAVDGRLPFTPNKLVLVEDRSTLVHNTLALAILKWGELARGEKNETNPELAFIEEVATKGLAKYGAFPKERNSPIYVLRTVEEEKALRAKRAAAQERALDMKARVLDAQEVLDESDTEEGQGSGVRVLEPATGDGGAAGAGDQDTDSPDGTADGEGGDQA